MGGALKATFFGAVGGAVSAGLGELFQSAKVVAALGKAKFAVQAAAHGISQGVLSVMQGGDFISGLVGGSLGSLGADLWGVTMKGLGYEKFAGSTMGMVSFGALSGGIGAELSGGNFWQGAVTGGIVAGLNHAMHKKSETSLKKILQNEKNIEEKITELFDSKKLTVGKKYTNKELKEIFPKEKMAKNIKSIIVKENNKFYVEWTGTAKFMSSVAYIRLEDGNITITKTKINNVNGYRLSGGALYIKDGNNTYKNLFIKGEKAWGILSNNKLTKSAYSE